METNEGTPNEATPGDASPADATPNEAATNDAAASDAKAMVMEIIDDVKAGNKDVIVALAGVVIAILALIGFSSFTLYNWVLLLGPACTGYALAKGLMPGAKKILMLAALSGVLFLISNYRLADGFASLREFTQSMRGLQQNLESALRR